MKYFITLLIVGLIVGLVLLRNTKEETIPLESTTQGEVISSQGLHWHSTLTIFVKGEQIAIPSNIGIAAVHNPMHTHDADGIIHLEYSGIVRTEDTELKRFFSIWNKPFNQNQLFDNMNGQEGTLTMNVNGDTNTEFENYRLKDGDVVELRFE